MLRNRSVALGLLAVCGGAHSAFGQTPNWHAVPFEDGSGSWGPGGTIYDLKTWDPDGGGSAPAVLVIAGNFTHCYLPGGGSFRANGICIWNGCTYEPLCDTTQSATDRGFTGGFPYALAVLGNDLYAGGTFTDADGAAAAGFCKWNGSAWVEVGGGVWNDYPNTVQDAVYALRAHGGTLYVGGGFNYVGSNNYMGLAKWSGSAWSSAGNVYKCATGGTAGQVFSLASEGSDLVVGGRFRSVGSTIAADVAWYSGSAWTATSNVLGLGDDIAVPPCPHGCSAFDDATDAVGSDGTYTWAGGINVSRLAYDSCNTASSPLTGVARSQRVTWTDASGAGAGPDMVPSSEFEVISSTLYAAGNKRLYPPSGSPQSWVHGVASWSGSAWVGVGDFISHEVYAIEEYNGQIYVGGAFSYTEATVGGGWRVLGCPLAVLSLACSMADIAGTGGVHVPDGVVDTNDLAEFSTFFFGGCLQADIGGTGGTHGRDGAFDNNDYTVLYDLYFAGCP